MRKINGCFATLIESLSKVIDMIYVKPSDGRYSRERIVYNNDEPHQSVINLDPRLTENRDNVHLNKQLFSQIEIFYSK